MKQANGTSGLFERFSRYENWTFAAAWLVIVGCGSKTDATGLGITAGAASTDSIGAAAGAAGSDSSSTSQAQGGTTQRSSTDKASASGAGGTDSVGTSWLSAGTGNAAGTAGVGYRLQGAPLSFAPTASGFGLNTVVIQGNPTDLRAQVRATGEATWTDPVAPEIRGQDIAQWRFDGLRPGLRYEYQLLAPSTSGESVLVSGSAVTQRPPGDAFVFSLITDSHIGPDLTFSNQGDPTVLQRVSAEAGAVMPDFMMNLGDMLDFHLFGFNDPPPSGSYTRQAYLNYRTLLGDTLGRTSHYAVIGNWEGEDGSYTPEEIARSRSQRLLYMPGPNPTTYPESGSPDEDYYAFTWGDALFVVLNVMSYTPTQHLLSSYPGLPDDWTLGATQLNWLSNTLANAQSKWKFLLIHHAVGGAAGDDANSGYGRGGGQAAYVGEQATVHALMLQYGAQIFFYGHDHVFADMVVDDIHYTLAGNAGAIWMFTQAETGYTQAWLEHGWTRVAVSPESVNVKFMAMGGELLYEYTLQ